jgi:hypothetical protein
MEDNTSRPFKRFFISHSSEDKNVVDIFVDKILRLGLSIDINDIAYTSREDTGVVNGENIPQYIKTNISNCEFVFFIVSENYRKSEVCLNEMGAAWAADRCVKILLLPNLCFNSIGWLYNLNKGTHLDNEEALDSLHDDIVERLNLTVKAATWNRCKKEFLGNIKSSLAQSANLPAVIEQIADSEEEWGLLDYREKFDENIELFNASMEELGKNTNLYSERVGQRTAQLTALAGNPYSNRQAKALMQATANDMNQFSNSIDTEEVNLKSYFTRAIEYAIKIQTISDVDQEVINDNRKAIQELINAIIVLKDTLITNKSALLASPKMEMTQNKAVRRLSGCHDNLIAVFDSCITEATILLKM